MAWTANPASMWGSGGLPNTFVSRATTRDNSSCRDAAQRPASARVEEIEGKSGSGSLVDGSFSMHSWDSRTPYGVKRTLTSDRSLPKTGFPDGASSQQRSFSTTSASQSLSGASQTFPFASRPQPVSLNPSSTQPRPAYGTTLSKSQSRGIDQPPTVYTKFDRPANPVKTADSAIGNGTSSFWPGTMSNSEVQTSFSQTDYSRSTARTTPTTSRAQSITSQTNGEHPGYANYGSEHLGMQFGQLSMNGNSRPPTSYRPTMPSNGTPNYGSSVNSNFSFARPHVNGASRGYDP
ncbi:mRNA binding protein puf3, partial [Friedmanniomyces endolithicus]